MKKWSWLAAPAIVIALAAAPAVAAGKGGGSNSVSLVRLTDGTTAASTSDPNFGEQVTFDVTSSVSQPYVLAECFQNGTRVYAELHGFWTGYMLGTTYTLGPTQAWQGGDADCTASLVDQSHSKTRVLATTTFQVIDPSA